MGRFTNLKAYPQGWWYHGYKEPRNSVRAGAFLHGHDAEVKAVNWLVKSLIDEAADEGMSYAGWQARAANLTGEVWIYASQGPCHSCRRVIARLSRDMPNVTFIVGYVARDPNRPYILKEGEEFMLYGRYGYEQGIKSESGAQYGVSVTNGNVRGFYIERTLPEDPPGGELEESDPASDFAESGSEDEYYEGLVAAYEDELANESEEDDV
ncbi:hypothetical protein [Streptomyces sp. 1222.5]|uniref:hypothetical protein n=1 Tax=Streptomyces sp. 1222.5 TaxID=1881026 RepID=UPI003D72706C